MSDVEGYALSPQQKRIWRIQHGNSAGRGGGRLVALLRLRGKLNPQVLRDSLGVLAARHSILRTQMVLPAHLKTPLQVVAQANEWQWHEVATVASNAKPGRLVREEVEVPTGDMASPRATFFRVDREGFLLRLSISGLCGDHASLKLLTGELASVYERLLCGETLKDEPVQYFQYSEWLQELAGEDEEGRAFWVEREGELQCPERFTARRPPEYEVFAITDSHAWKRGTKPTFERLLVCWKVLLARSYSLAAVSVGVAFDGRTFDELQNCCGPFLRYLPLTLNIEETISLEEAQKEVEGQINEAAEWQDFYDLNQGRRTKVPVFGFESEVMAEPIDKAGLCLESIDFFHWQEDFGLKLTVVRTGENHVYKITYDKSRFQPAEIHCLAERYRVLLGAAMVHHGARVGALPILTPAERAHLLQKLGSGGSRSVPQRHVAAMLQVPANNHTDRIILVSSGIGRDRFYSYGQAHELADSTARMLRDHGMGPEKRVGILFERSPEMMIALLAVMKSGAAFVPLDPAFPVSRLNFMVSELDALLEDAKLNHPSWDKPTFTLELGQRNVRREDLPNPKLGGAQAAYLIFTSGSTGFPKAVIVCHANLCHYLEAATAELELRECRSFGHVSTLAADLGNTSLFPALAWGRTLHVLTREQIGDPQAFGDVFQNHLIEVLKITPSHLAALMQQPAPARVLPQKRLILGGEAASLDMIRVIRQVAPGLPIFNHYGPTETTVGVAVHPITTVPEEGRIPVGRPLPNTRIFLLNVLGHLTPWGTPGELHVGGPLVTRGYSGDARATASRFLPNPYDRQPGRRMYRSGDRAVFLADGNLAFLGRVDFQVKIRGYRVEPGEIEAVLKGHADLVAAVIVPWREAAGDGLLGYVVPQPTAAPWPELQLSLRAYLQERLPSYMIPGQWVSLAKLPLTANGKVDRQALPNPSAREDHSPHSGQAPRTETERVLAQIWERVLGRMGVGIEDNFFALGGHSLSGTIIMSRVLETFQVTMPLATLFEKPTIQKLAQAVNRARMAQAEPGRAQEAAKAMGIPWEGPKPWNRISPESLDGLLTLIKQVPQSRQVITKQPRMGERPVFPLSFAQQRMWFLDQMENTDGVYHLSPVLRLKGVFDLGAMNRTLSEIVRRHEILRTCFPFDGERPRQVVFPPQEIQLPLADLSGLPETRAEAEMLSLAREATRRPFNLQAGPLFRACLLRLARRDHVSIMTMHHIIFDGWSGEIFIAELIAGYRAFVRGNPPGFPEPEIQYADFASWQTAWLQGDTVQNQLAFWLRHLEGAPEWLALPNDRPRPLVANHRGGEVAFQIPAGLTGQLKQLGEAQKATLFMTLQAAFVALLSRYSGQRDILLGTPIANRNREEIQKTIGFFINTLVLRNRLEGNPSFGDLLAGARKVAMDAYAHQDVPFEMVVEAINPERDPGRQPLFQVMFLLQDTWNKGPVQLPGLTLSLVEQPSFTAKFDLTLWLGENDRGIGGYLEYAELFDRTTVVRMTRHYLDLLVFSTRHPQWPLTRWNPVKDAERQLLLREWNDTRAPYPREGGIHGVFETLAARVPHATALVHQHRYLSYGALNERANQWAQWLSRKGLNLEARTDAVGLHMDRSLDLPAGMLGILKTGASYLPLDPSYPKRRLQFMLEDSGVDLVLADDDAEIMGEPNQVEFGRPALGLDRMPTVFPSVRVDPRDRAYIMYTSGSTGRPKGIEIPHRGVTRLAYGTFVDWERITVMLLMAPVSFDAATFELWGALLRGRRCVLFTERVPTLAGMAAAFCEHAVDGLWLTASLFNTVVDEDVRLLKGISQLFIGGERLSPLHVAQAFRRLPKTRFINGYGPTENTTFTCCYPITGKPDPDQPISIGRPISNTRIYVLDPTLRVQPIGITGELFAAGAGLARGYNRRPGKTAKNFIPNPLCRFPGKRLYRTGDLARICPDGTVAFLERIDRQVKLRGFRIELGEIEAALLGHPWPRKAVVVVRVGAAGLKRIIAYLELNQPDAVPRKALEVTLKNFLLDRLPEYMVPDGWQVLARLPLTPNGKIDREALPPPGESALTREEEVYPRTPLEEIVRDLIAGVLGIHELSVDTNFFDAGGNSILATRVVSQIRRHFELDIPLRKLFESPTVRGLAAVLEEKRRRGQGSPLPTLTRRNPHAPIPLSFAQQRLWFLDRLDPENANYNIPFAVRGMGPWCPRALERGVRQIYCRHEVLRTRYEERREQPTQIVSSPPAFRLPVIDLRLVADKNTSVILAKGHAQLPFFLQSDLMLRACMLRLAADDHHLLVCMHHIAADGWSTEILFREMGTFYESNLYGRSGGNRLPELPIQYGDYALWQRNWLDDEVMAKQLKYWVTRLEGLPTLNLPTDRQRPELQTYRGKNRAFTLPTELADQLRALSRKAGTTAFMTFLTGFQVFLSRYSGQADIVVGWPSANRTQPETETLIGFFVNTLVHRLQIKEKATFGELLAQTRQSVLEAFAFGDLPFEKLVEALQPNRDLSRSPLFQVMFSLETGSGELRELPAKLLPGLNLARLDWEEERAKFDLSLTLREHDNSWSGFWNYNTDLFDSVSIARMGRHFETLLGNLVAQPDRTALAIGLLDPAERHAVLYAWNDQPTVDDFPLRPWLTVPGQVAESVALVMDAPRASVAVHLSYRVLVEQVSRLAGCLRERGVAPDKAVGVYAERSPELAIAMLAVLEAGGAYLPLTPGLPRARLEQMVKDAEPDLVLVQAGLQDWEPSSNTMTLPRRSNDMSPAKEGWPPQPHHAAYLIYTSGSTGVPKGVLISRVALANQVRWLISRFCIRAADRLLQKTAVSFDASIWEFLAPLSVGATLVLARPGGHQDPAYLADCLQRQCIDLLQVVPTQLRALLAETSFTQNPWPRLIFSGGEALSAEIATRVLQRSGSKLVNLYGPTETCINATYQECESAPEIGIGRPLTKHSCLVLDEKMGLLPMGVGGELFIGGAGLARGYLNRPGDTAWAFLPDPLAFGGPGSRLYRSGDLVRFLHDGTLAFLGRTNHQIKLRGNRIELGEIETRLRRHAAVSEALVQPWPNHNEVTHLVAYLQRVGGFKEREKRLAPDEMRDFLAQWLPDYMIPSLFITLRAFPLTASGKIDRRALPEPSWEAKDNRLPRNPTEELLQQIFYDILGVPRLGIDDDFFALGGHSLLATRVLARVRGVFQKDIPLKRFFEGPTVAQLAQAIAESRRYARPGISPRPEAWRQGPPLSFAQERLWFLEQLEPTGAYNTPSSVRLIGPIAISALEKALNEVVSRHEILRTTFPGHKTGPVQWIVPQLRVMPMVCDLSLLPRAVRAELESDLIARDSLRPFDLGRGPLLRICLLRGRRDRHLLLLNMHHIISDGWSMSLLLKELTVGYRNSLVPAARRTDLASLPIQFADYAVWLRQWLRGAVLDEQLAYWKNQLAQQPSHLTLATDRPRPELQTFNGSAHFFSLSPAISQSLNNLGKAENSTKFMTLLSAFYMLLHRYSGQTDISVGTNIANRGMPEIEPLIGFFINTLVLRTDLSDLPSFRQLLTRVRGMVVEAFDHQETPFERLVEELQPQRDLNMPPLFQVMFVWENNPPPVNDFPGLDMEVAGSRHLTAKFDITLFMSETPRGLEGLWEFNRDLFEPATIGRMSERFQILLAAVADRPDHRVFDLLVPAEKARLREWNQTRANLGGPALVHPWFEARARRVPDRPALVWGNDTISYGVCENRANQLAEYLASLGAGPEIPVALCLGRSLELLTGMLAILKAGSCYVPMDPAYPMARLGLMLEDSGAAILLTDRDQAMKFPNFTGTVVHVDAPRRVPEKVPRQQIIVPDHLAYLIYTSGSTGKPKGVAMCHHSLANLIVWQVRVSPLSETTRVTQFASVSFDVSFQEIFYAWAGGGTLVMVPPETRMDMAALAAFIGDRAIGRLFLPFVVLQQLVLAAAEHAVRPPRYLREIVTSGERLQITSPLRRYEAQAGCRHHNQYGPTETHVCTAYHLEGAPNFWPALPPIGKPITNATHYLLNSGLQPAFIGVAGELFIAGKVLARGYYGKPDLTAVRFLPNPFSDDPGDRFYRSGDAARFLTDGTLEFVERIDAQVKIRGFRVEPGEVEANLREHPAVGDAAVIAERDARGLNRLIAYVRPAKSQPRQTVTFQNHLRDFLADRLPEYMIPAAWMTLAKFPLTPSGKLNRGALPPLPTTEREVVPRPPQSPVEEILSGIFAEILDLSSVDPEKSFFEMGGHSLLATQAISRIRQAFGVKVPLRALFENPAVAGLARVVISEIGTLKTTEPPRLRALERSETPLSFAQQRLWFIQLMAPEDASYNISFAIRLQGPLHAAALARAMDDIQVRHHVLRARFENRDGQPIQVVDPIRYRTMCLIDFVASPKAGTESFMRKLAASHASLTMDLDRGFLFRTCLLRREPRDHFLFINMHHMISDGWSLGILIREIGHLYARHAVNDTPALPPLPIQYGDFAMWQRSWLRDDVLAMQLDYWRDQFQPEPEFLALPTDRARPKIQTFRGHTLSEELPAALCGELEILCRREGVTTFMALLGAFKALLYRYTGQDDIVVGAPIANRNHVEIEPLIGFFVNTLALRSRFSSDSGFADLLAGVRENALAAHAHQDLPFEKLVEEIQPERDLSRTPLFQVLFAFQNMPVGRFSLPGIDLTRVSVDFEPAKFDLTMAIEEVDHRLFVSLNYNRDLFEKTTIQRMFGHFRTLLSGLCADLKRPLSTQPLLAEAERHQLLLAWNDTREPFEAKARLLHEEIDGWARETPDAVAVVHDRAAGRDRHVSYALLDRATTLLALHLRGLGVLSDQAVGVCMNRSVEMVLSLIGILKAGAAYLPLEPNLPGKRLQFMLQESDAGGLFSQLGLQKDLPPFARPVLWMDDPALVHQVLGRCSQGNKLPIIHPDQAAYLIYTSGSTGLPKGVINAHRGISNRLHWMQARFKLERGARLLQKTTFSFDVSVWEFFWPLRQGACLVLAQPEGHRDPAYLARAMSRQSITHIHFVPSMLQAFIPEFKPEMNHRLQIVFASGERVTRDLEQQCHLRKLTLYNLYGPTEAGVEVTCWPCSATWSGETVPIGRPLAHNRIHILSEKLHPQPIGVSGHLHIAGRQLARGYWRRPGLTARTFIPNPFSGSPGERLYRSGDRARHLPMGAIDFLGRLDYQIKLRGQRVELGEIESWLRKQHGVRDAVVVMLNQPIERLAAYLVVENSAPDDPSLRRELGIHLPPYMIPAVFVRMDALPLTPSGKIDRKALPVPEFSPSHHAARAPNQTEATLMTLWTETMDVGELTVASHFFELGGHSLLATQLISRIRKRFRVEIPVQDFFQMATIEKMALYIDTAIRAREAALNSTEEDTSSREVIEI